MVEIAERTVTLILSHHGLDPDFSADIGHLKVLDLFVWQLLGVGGKSWLAWKAPHGSCRL